MSEQMADSGAPTSMSKRALLAGAAASIAVAAAGALSIRAFAKPPGPLPTLDRLRAVEVGAYPSLSRVELGMLTYQYRKATAKDGDWSLWEPGRTFDGAPGIMGIEDEGTQYDLFVSASAVANAVNKTPAYREFAETVLGGICEKGFDDRCWRYWTESTSGSGNNGIFMPYSPDPIPNADAMYIGNMGGALSLYALMTDSRRFDQPRDFVYRGPGVEFAGQKVRTGTTWRHSWTDIVDSVTRQIDSSEKRMVMCQIPTVYFMCNLSIAQSILGYDRVMGTDRARTLYGSDGFFDRNGETMFVPPRSTGKPPTSVTFGQKQIDGQWIATPDSALGDLFLTFGLYPTKPDWARDTYEMCRKKWLVEEADGSASWSAEVAGMQGSPAMKAGATMAGAVGASFVGDKATRARTLAYIEREYGPTWDGDMLVYKSVYEKPEDYLRAGGMQGSMLEVHSTADGCKLANFDIDRARFREPTVVGASFPEVKVTRATFDRSASALIVSIAAARDTSFRVEKLAPGTEVVVLRNKEVVQRARVPEGPGGIRIPVKAGTHDLVIGVQV